MKYGIDLGTTNSAICKMENGEPRIIKADDQKDIMASCVSFRKRKDSAFIKVGQTAYNDLRQDRGRATKNWIYEENVFIEFKRTMGLDTKYYSPNMGKEFTSEDLSAEVLKTLKSFVNDDNITSCVITIPAKFTPDQIAATKRAANMAGITHCDLLQEPIAAAMAYGLTTESKNGHWIVFDFGGGTFDAAVLNVEDGIIQVTDTEGDNYLGGKNLDYAIVDDIFIPYLENEFSIDSIMEDDNNRSLLRNALKYYAEAAKNELSFKDETEVLSQIDEYGDDDEGVPIELDMKITKQDLVNVFTPIFQKAVDITKDLIKRNHLEGQLDKLILVGGPTFSPILRNMLREQVTDNIDTSIDPMTAVAKGAALYASGIESEVIDKLDEGTVALDVQYNSNSVEELEFVSVKLLPKDSTGTIPDKVFVEFKRGEGGWASGRIEITEMGDVVECQLLTGRANSFSIYTYDEFGNPFPCFPNEITIIQGTAVGNAILPRNIGIEAHDEIRDKDVFMPLKGLEKNKQLPAVGVRNGLKTPKRLRPGNTDDRLVIPVYIGENDAEGTSAIYNDHVFDVVVTGDDIPALIPENSDIDITISVDMSQMMKLEVYFPAIGETVEKDIEIAARSVDEEELRSRFSEADGYLQRLRSISSLSRSEMDAIDDRYADIADRFDNEITSDDGKMHLLADLRALFRDMEKTEKNHEWDFLEAELRQEFARLDKANGQNGHEYDAQVADLRRRTDDVIRRRDISLGQQVLEDIKEVYISCTFVSYLVGFIRYHDSNFSTLSWKNANVARTHINNGKRMIASGHLDVEELRQECVLVLEQLDIPENEKPKF